MSPTFAQLGVPETICNALKQRGVTKPFEIQAATVADALAGRDICGRAPAGSGKTLAFGIPLVASVGRAAPRRPRALVLAPTRELAEQINAVLRSFAGAVRIGVVYGGLGYATQIRALRWGVDILVACPGRLEDLIAQGVVSLSAIDRVVLDEADRMADMGFLPAVRRLLDQTARHRQTMLFSATLDRDVAKLTRDYQRDPVRHEVGVETPDITAAQHVFWNTARVDRPGFTAEAIGAVWPAIVFCRTRHGSNRLAKQLGRAGIQAATIHGGRSQNQRTRALADFANGRVQALVATDVAARGIHVDGVASVIHYDSPEDHKTYLHRSGRTARAGQGGVVVSLVQPDQVQDLRRLQRQIGLNEPFTAPDARALRDLSPSPLPAKNSAAADGQEARVGAPRRAHTAAHQDHRGRAPAGRHRGRLKAQHRMNASQTPASGRSWAKAKSNGSSGTGRSRPNRRARRTEQRIRAAAHGRRELAN
ncbi:MAG: RNA helicase [Dehalococcoidia bacterium]|nr:RNA helicase [Dehalococcoidia bacterium]